MDGNLDGLLKTLGVKRAESKDTAPKIPARPNPFDHYIEDSGARNGVDPALIRAMMSQESSGNPNARSNKDAHGLMQLIPATAARFGVTDIYDPQQNIEGGTKYAKFLLDKFGGNVDLALAGYNAGEGAVDKYKGIPPYAETRNYVQRIRSNYKGSGYLNKPDNGLAGLLGQIGTVNQPEQPDNGLGGLLNNLGTDQPVPGQSPAAVQTPPVNPTAELEKQRADLIRQRAASKSLKEKKTIDASVKKLSASIEAAKRDIPQTGQTVQPSADSYIIKPLPTDGGRNVQNNQIIEAVNAMRQAAQPTVSPEMVNEAIHEPLHDVQVPTGSSQTVQAQKNAPQVKTVAGTPTKAAQPKAETQPDAETTDYQNFLAAKEVVDSPEARSEYQQLQKDSPEVYGAKKRTDITRNVKVPEGVSVRDALKDATRKLVYEKGIDATSEDIDAAIENNPIKLDSGETATDSYLEKFRGEEIPHTLTAKFFDDVEGAKRSRLKRESIDARVKSGELTGAKNVIGAMKDAGLISPEKETELLDNESKIQAEEDAAQKRYEEANPSGLADLSNTPYSDNPDERRKLSTVYPQDEINRPRVEAEAEQKKRALAYLDKYGSYAKGEKAIAADKAEQDKYASESHPFGQSTEALKTATRYIAKIPGTLIDTLALARDASPVNIVGDYLSGTDSKPLVDNLTKAADSYRKTIDNDLVLKQNQVFKNDFIVNEVSEGLAQFAVQIVAAPLTGGYSLALPLAEGATAQYKEASAGGADRKTRILAALVGGIAGVPDVLLDAKYLRFLTPLEKNSFISKLTRGLFTKYAEKLGEEEAKDLTKVTVSSFLKHAAFGFAGESAQEYSEDIINDLTAKATYKPDLNLADTFLPNAQKVRGYLSAGIAGAFGGTVETVTEKMTVDELVQTHKGLDELLADNRIGKADYDRITADIAEKLKGQKLSLPQLLKQQQNKPISQTVQEFVNSLSPQAKAQEFGKKAFEGIKPVTIGKSENQVETPKVDNLSTSENTPETSAKQEGDLLTKEEMDAVLNDGKNNSVPETPQVGDTIEHSNPDINGAEVIATTSDNKVVVKNDNNKSGISVIAPNINFKRKTNETKTPDAQQTAPQVEQDELVSNELANGGNAAAKVETTPFLEQADEQGYFARVPKAQREKHNEFNALNKELERTRIPYKIEATSNGTKLTLKTGISADGKIETKQFSAFNKISTANEATKWLKENYKFSDESTSNTETSASPKPKLPAHLQVIADKHKGFTTVTSDEIFADKPTQPITKNDTVTFTTPSGKTKTGTVEKVGKAKVKIKGESALVEIGKVGKVEAKEPYQMTRNEFLTHLSEKDKYRGSFDHFNKEGTKEIFYPRIDEDFEINGTNYRYGTYSTHVKGKHLTTAKKFSVHKNGSRIAVFSSGTAKQNLNNAIRAIREDQIKQALRQGKTIPPEVLKDYPDLQQHSPQPEPDTKQGATGIEAKSEGETPTESNHVQTETNNEIESLPVSQRVTPEDLGDDVKLTRAKVADSVGKEKIQAKTGFTKTQTEWFVGELQKAYDKFAADEQPAIDFDLTLKGAGHNAARIEAHRQANREKSANLLKNGLVIDIPGDGAFTFATQEGVDRIHKKITGKTIEDWREAQDKTDTFEKLPLAKGYSKLAREAKILQEDGGDVSVETVNETLGVPVETMGQAQSLGVTQVSNGFWIRNITSGKYDFVTATPVKIKGNEGLDVFAHKYNNETRISDGITGMKISSGTNIDNAVGVLNNLIKARGVSAIDSAVKKEIDNGNISPRYDLSNAKTDTESASLKMVAGKGEELAPKKRTDEFGDYHTYGDAVDVNGNWKRLDSLPDSQIIAMFHATSKKNAESIRNEGYNAKQSAYTNTPPDYVYLGAKEGLGTYEGQQGGNEPVFAVFTFKKQDLEADAGTDWKTHLKNKSSRTSVERFFGKSAISTPSPIATYAEIGQVRVHQSKVQAVGYIDRKNNNTFVSFDNSDSLKKVSTPEDITNLHTLRSTTDKTDLLPRITSDISGDVVNLSPEASEIINSARDAANYKRDGEKYKVEVARRGEFNDASNAASLVKDLTALETWLHSEDVGYDKNDTAGIRKLISDIKEAGKENGTVILKTYDEALPHERFHQIGYLSAGKYNKGLTNRIADFPKFVENNSDFLDKVHNSFFGKNGYDGEKDVDQIVEETATYLATGDYETLGIDTGDDAAMKEAHDYLYNWFEAYENKNGRGSLENFEKFFDETQNAAKILEGLKNEKVDKQGQSGGKGKDSELRTGDANSQDAEGKKTKDVSPTDDEGSGTQAKESESGTPERLRDGDKNLDEDSAIADITGETPEAVKTKNRQFAKSLSNSFYNIGDVEYEPQTEQKWLNQSNKDIDELGVDGAIKKYDSLDPKHSEGYKTALGVAIASDLYANGDTKQFIDFGKKLTTDIGNIAQELRATQLLARLSPEHAVLAAQSIKEKSTGEDLTDKEIETVSRIANRLKEVSDDLDSANAILADNEVRQAESDKIIAEISNALKDEEAKRTALKKDLAKAKASATYYRNRYDENKPPRTNTKAELKAFKVNVLAKSADYSKALEKAFGVKPALKMVAGQKLLAPNGKPSNLTPFQHVQVRSKPFLDWFGDWLNDPKNASKVVDENGEPLVMYHGATGDIETWNLGITPDVNLSSGKGGYFTTDPKAASRYAEGMSWGNANNTDIHPNTVPVFLNIRKPFNKNAQYKISDFKSVLSEDSDLVTEIDTEARPSDEFIAETDEELNNLQNYLFDLESIGADSLASYYPEEFDRYEREDYDTDEEYNEAIEEARQDEIEYVTKQVNRLEKQIEDSWANYRREVENASVVGNDLWDDILTSLDSYYDLAREKNLFGGDVESFETDTEVANILRDAYGFDGVERIDTFPIKEKHKVFIANASPNQIKSAIGNNGEFSPNNDSILKMVAPKPPPHLDEEVFNILSDLGAVKLIDELPNGLTLADFNKYLDTLSNGELTQADKVTIHANAWTKITPDAKESTPEEIAIRKNRAEHGKQAAAVLNAEAIAKKKATAAAEKAEKEVEKLTEKERRDAEREAEKELTQQQREAKKAQLKAESKAADQALADNDAYRYDKYGKAIVNQARAANAAPETVFTAFALRELANERLVRELVKKEYPAMTDKEFRKLFVEATNLLGDTREAVRRDLAAVKANKKTLTDEEYEKINNDRRDLEKQVRQAKSHLAQVYKEVAMSKPRRVLNVIEKIYNIPRALGFSSDAGFLSRQGGKAFLTDNAAWRKAGAAAIPALFNKTKLDNLLHDAYKSDIRKLMEARGGKFKHIGETSTSYEDLAHLFSEEGLDYKNDTGLKKAIKQAFNTLTFIPRRTNLAHGAFLDTLQLNVFKKAHEQLVEMKDKGKLTDADVKRAEEFFAQKFIPIQSGSGYGGKNLDPALNVLSRVPFAAPRLRLSHVQFFYYMNPARNAFLPKGARKIIAEKQVRFYAPLLSFVALGLLSGLIGGDDKKSDFLKIKGDKIAEWTGINGFKDMQFDLSGGAKEPARAMLMGFEKLLYSTVAKNPKRLEEVNNELYKMFITAPFYKNNKFQGEQLGRFWAYGLHPTLGIARSLWNEQDAIGKPYGAGKAVTDFVLPLPPRQIYDAATYDTPEKDQTTIDRIIRISLSTLGEEIGVNTANFRPFDGKANTKPTPKK